MNRNIRFTVIILMFFSTWFNPALTYASFNKTPDGYSKSVVASSRTLWVPVDYANIQEAIDNANEGDTIFVGEGTYYEHVKIDKSLTLVGENGSTTVIDGNGTGIVVHAIANHITLSGFTIQNGVLGIWLSRSNNNILTGNNVSNNQYGIYSWSSIYNVLSGNIALDNQYGIYFSWSRNNAFTGNIASNNDYGIYLDGSDFNTLTGNNISLNDDSGILLYHSINNVLSGNIALDNQYGICLSDSDNNILTGITVANNRYGIRLTSSRNNMIYHNNFVKNAEHVKSIDSVNSWDNGAEGNYWSGYVGDDANWDGIGDTPYSIHVNNQDNYPLMATFLQFTVVKRKQSYKIDTVSSSTISNLQYHYEPDNKINAASFKVNDAEGKGFCRISISHGLIEPPYTITVDQNPSLYFERVYENETHTWLYFTYEPLEHEVTVMHTPYPEQLVLSRWAILGLTIIIIILLSININYYRKLNKQKKVIEIYERELGSFPVTHFERARLLFIKDVIERKEKIGKFKEKYGIKIQPAGTLGDLMEKLGIKKRKKVNH